MIDSGAELSCIDPELAQKLGLPLESFLFSNVPSGAGFSVSAQYRASVLIVHPSGNPFENLVVQDLPVMELRLGTLAYQALIGRDILDSCRFVYDGRRGRYQLAY